MASVHRQLSKSPYWLARFKMPDGKWVSRTTKLTEKAAAERLAFEWEGAASSPCELSPTGAAIGRVTREIYERTYRTKINPVTIAGFLRGWIARMESTKAPGTARRYKQVVEAFIAYLGPNGERSSLSTLSMAVLQGFVDAESAKAKKGAHTVSMLGKVLRAAVNSASRVGHIEGNPGAGLELPDYKMQEKEEFSPGEVELLLQEAKGTEWETVILFGAYCGCRLGDAVSIKWSNMDLAKAVLTYVPQKTARGSRRKTLENPLPERLLVHLNELAGRPEAKESEHITPGLARMRISGRSGLSMSFSALMRRAGIESEKIAPEVAGARSFRKKTFHSTRHFFVSNLRRGGADLETAQIAAGHSDEATNARYDHDKKDRVHRKLADAVRKMPGASQPTPSK